MRARAAGNKPDLVDRAELTKRLGVGTATMNRWHRRSILPEPDIRLGAQDLWLWETVREWAKERRSFRKRRQADPLPDVVDLHALARRLDVAPDAAAAWKQNGFLPEPDYRWERTEGWLWETIRRWDETTSMVQTAHQPPTGRSDGPNPAPLPLIPAIRPRSVSAAHRTRDNAPLPTPPAPPRLPAAIPDAPDPIREMELIKDYFSEMAAGLTAGESAPD